jgi:hypothetical protein
LKVGRDNTYSPSKGSNIPCSALEFFVLHVRKIKIEFVGHCAPNSLLKGNRYYPSPPPNSNPSPACNFQYKGSLYSRKIHKIEPYK